MTTKVQKSITVNLPVSTVYNQWTQFEDFPQFMNGVTSITTLDDDRMQWVAEIGGVRRQWEAKVLEQVPDQKVSWAATEGATNAGSVTFQDLGGRTLVNLFLEYEPEGLVEKVGDKLNVVEKQAEGDLERFKAFIESEGYASGAWRGTVSNAGHVGTPGVEHAESSRGDDGKAGVSGKAVAAGVGVAAAAVAGAVAAATAGKSDDEVPVTPVETISARTVQTETETAPAPAPVTGTTAENPPHVFSPEEVEAGEAGPITGTVPENPGAARERERDPERNLEL